MAAMHLLPSMRSARSCGCSRRYLSAKAPPAPRSTTTRSPPWPHRNHNASAPRSRPTTTSASSSSSQFIEHTRRNSNILPLHLVNSSQAKLALPIIGNAAYVTLASGFLMTDMLTLRLALVGGYAGLVAFHSLHARPLRIPLRWSALFVLVNAGAACMLIADQFPGSLSEEEEGLYEEHFARTLSRGQFKRLMDLGRSRVVEAGTRLTVEGVHSDTLYFTKRGHCELYLRGRYAKDIDEGSFVNDVAFQQHYQDGGGNNRIMGAEGGAYGTVVADGEVEVVEWNYKELREHLEKRPDMDRNIRLCLTSHLVKGLLQQRKAAYSNNTGGEMMGGFRQDLLDNNMSDA